MKQTESGLFLPEEKKVERKIRQLVAVRFAGYGPCGADGLAVLADDGTMWLLPPNEHDWKQIPALPQ